MKLIQNLLSLKSLHLLEMGQKYGANLSHVKSQDFKLHDNQKSKKT